MEHNRSIKEPRSLGVSLTKRDYIVRLAHKKYKLLKTNAFILIWHICRILLNKSQHCFKIGQMMHNQILQSGHHLLGQNFCSNLYERSWFNILNGSNFQWASFIVEFHFARLGKTPKWSNHYDSSSRWAFIQPRVKITPNDGHIKTDLFFRTGPRNPSTQTGLIYDGGH